jgi:hypothetical protein
MASKDALPRCGEGLQDIAYFNAMAGKRVRQPSAQLTEACVFRDEDETATKL